VRASRRNLPVVVFSDVDGVLSEPWAPTSAAAANVLEPLARAHVALILCSCKTRAELEVIQQELGIRHPFVCEGGGAVLIPREYFDFAVPHSREHAGYDAVEFGRPYVEVAEKVHRTAELLGIDIVGFRDMSVEEVARDCKIPLLRARLAKLREYQEPFRVLDPDAGARRRLVKALSGARLRCTSDGRYDYAGAAIGNSLGAQVLRECYRRAHGRILTIGLADAMGDDDLLRLVDFPIIVHDDPAARGAVDLLGWAEAIVATVQDLSDASIPPELQARTG
jgi:mannosyl-3-phosphoglycerate phosphatase